MIHTNNPRQHQITILTNTKAVVITSKSLCATIDLILKECVSSCVKVISHSSHSQKNYRYQSSSASSFVTPRFASQNSQWQVRVVPYFEQQTSCSHNLNHNTNGLQKGRYGTDAHLNSLCKGCAELRKQTDLLLFSNSSTLFYKPTTANNRCWPKANEG